MDASFDGDLEVRQMQQWADRVVNEMPNPARRKTVMPETIYAAGPLVPAVAPDTNISEIDTAITRVRADLAAQSDAIAKLDARLTATSTGDRIKALLTGKRDDRQALVRQRDELADTLAVAEGELRELLALRAPHEATSAAFSYDKELRPKVQALLRELAVHLQAAADVLTDPILAEADQACRTSSVRTLMADRSGALGLASIDRRELDLMERWRSHLVGYDSRFEFWKRDAASFRVNLTGKK